MRERRKVRVKEEGLEGDRGRESQRGEVRRGRKREGQKEKYEEVEGKEKRRGRGAGSYDNGVVYESVVAVGCGCDNGIRIGS